MKGKGTDDKCSIVRSYLRRIDLQSCIYGSNSLIFAENALMEYQSKYYNII